MHPSIRWLALGLLLATSGCWTRSNTAATAEYARQVSTANLRTAQLESQLADSLRRLEQLEEVIRLRGQDEASQLENIDQVNAELARLRGQLEVLQFQLDDLTALVETDQIGRERRQLHDENRLTNIERFLGIEAPPVPTDADLGIDVSSARTSPTPGPRDSQVGMPEELPTTVSGKLELAIRHMEAGRQGVARAVLQRAIQEHAGAEEMAELRYRYAETFMNEEQWRTAILEFKKVSDNHPDSEWSCWAYYRQGEAMERVSGPDDARLFYSGATVGTCRNTEAARAARQKL